MVPCNAEARTGSTRGNRRDRPGRCRSPGGTEEIARLGDAWRQRWDSLRLFTPARFDALDGMPFPAPATYFPTKDEMADYLEAYAAHFDLPVRSGVRVDRLSKTGDTFMVEAGGRRYEAGQT